MLPHFEFLGDAGLPAAQDVPVGFIAPQSMRSADDAEAARACNRSTDAHIGEVPRHLGTGGPRE